MKESTTTFIRILKHQIQLLQDVLPSETEPNQVKISREIFILEARILKLKKYHKQVINVQFETFESNLNYETAL